MPNWNIKAKLTNLKDYLKDDYNSAKKFVEARPKLDKGLDKILSGCIVGGIGVNAAQALNTYNQFEVSTVKAGPEVPEFYPEPAEGERISITSPHIDKGSYMLMQGVLNLTFMYSFLVGSKKQKTATLFNIIAGGFIQEALIPITNYFKHMYSPEKEDGSRTYNIIEEINGDFGYKLACSLVRLGIQGVIILGPKISRGIKWVKEFIKETSAEILDEAIKNLGGGSP